MCREAFPLRTLIIAEAGVNHNGDIDIARDLIKEAANAGADIVKFQTFTANSLVTLNAPKAKYQKITTGVTGSQKQMLRKLELSLDDHYRLMEYCEDCAVEFLSTGFDTNSLDLLKKLNMKRHKIPSGEINNLIYLEQIGSLGKPILMSTGMANLGEIEKAIEVLESVGTKRENITVLQCTTDYPAKAEDANLLAIKTIHNAFNVDVGYSDHTCGIETAIAAVALGAKVIEKHITLDNDMEGPDHKASIDPNGFSRLVESIRNIEKGLGSGIKRPTENEKINIPIVRKSIVAAKPIQVGEVFSLENITLKRPGTGISPMRIRELLGKRSTKKYIQDDLINLQ